MFGNSFFIGKISRKHMYLLVLFAYLLLDIYA